jgi:hypothetical protein
VIVGHGRGAGDGATEAGDSDMAAALLAASSCRARDDAAGIYAEKAIQESVYI